MENQNIYKTLSSYKKVLEDKGYIVLYIGLYGSQNYNLDDEDSDIDAKAIILPSLHDIIFRKTTSVVIECENGNIDVKDLLTFYNTIKKGNFSYIETINTTYSIGDKYIKKLFQQVEPNLKSMLGAMYEKRKALTHEYPSKHIEFEKWGFDPKQYHHIIRLYDLLKYNTENKDYLSYLTYTGEEKKSLIQIKRNKENLKLAEVELSSNYYIEEARKLIPNNYVYNSINLDKEIGMYIEKYLKINLLRNSPIFSAKEYRTFDMPIPKKDLEKFPILKEYDGKDVSYIVYESIDIL